MDLTEIQKRNYDATVRRGLITYKTTFDDFIRKLDEEVLELSMSYNNGKLDETELADIMIVCLAMAKYFNIDIQKALEQKTIYNESRK